jgi:SAM-dependent methyltransferase
LLEIGCGAGNQLAALRQAGWDAHGVDFDPAAVATARGRGLQVDQGDVRDLHYPDASFDAVAMAHVIEHVANPVGLLTEIARLLKPGGRLVLITPNARSLGHLYFKRFWRGLEPPRHLVVFTPRALRRAVERGGLIPGRSRFSGRDAANLLLASERAKRAPPGHTIERPREDVAPPLRLRLIERLEFLSSLLGLPWAEEQILLCMKSPADAAVRINAPSPAERGRRLESEEAARVS